MHLRPAVVFVAAAVSLCATPFASAADGLMFTNRTEATPPIGEQADAGVGRAVYTETEYPVQVFARLLEDVTVTAKGHVLERGTLLQGEIFRGRPLYCAMELYQAGPWRVRVLCLMDPDLDSRFEGLHLVDYQPPRKYPLDVPYETVQVPASSAGGRSVKREIVYLGSGAGVLRLGYREYVNNLAREAFAQEASYDLEEGVTEVAFNGARIEVLEANNTAIRYRVIEGFAD